MKPGNRRNSTVLILAETNMFLGDEKGGLLFWQAYDLFSKQKGSFCVNSMYYQEYLFHTINTK